MFALHIKTGNDAFGDTDSSRAAEVARMLRLVASQLERGSREAPILDSNGNRVGRFLLEREG